MVCYGFGFSFVRIRIWFLVFKNHKDLFCNYLKVEGCCDIFPKIIIRIKLAMLKQPKDQNCDFPILNPRDLFCQYLKLQGPLL